MAFFLTLAPFFQQVFLERACQVLWHTRPPDGLLEGHIFTDGSSLGSGALRRAGWAVVAVDDAGNLKAAAYGAVPSDVLPGQSARDGEDYAAAMAGQFTLDPLTLYIDCEGTIATVNGPKPKALGAQGPRAHVWNRLLFSHDEVRAVKVKGHATERDVEAGRTSHLCKKGNDLADTFAKKEADTHKPAFRVAKTVVASASLAKQAARWAAEAHVLLRFRGWNDTRAAVQQARARPPRARLRSEIAARTSGQVCDWLSPIVPSRFSQDSHLDHHLCAKCGAVYWERADALCRRRSEFPGGRASQLRKLRSGLFPNKRNPGWTVEHVRRPTLDEAATLVAQLESCEAGLGRMVLGPTTPKKQRVAPQAAVLAHWGSVGEAIDNENPRAAAFRPGAVEVVGGVWAQRSVGVKAHPQGRWCALSQDRLIWQLKSGPIVCFQHGPSETSALCVQWVAMGLPAPKAEPYNIWNALLAALVHFRIGEVLQLLTSEEMGLVAMSCHFACDALCAELYDWEAAEPG